MTAPQHGDRGRGNRRAETSVTAPPEGAWETQGFSPWPFMVLSIAEYIDIMAVQETHIRSHVLEWTRAAASAMGWNVHVVESDTKMGTMVITLVTKELQSVVVHITLSDLFPHSHRGRVDTIQIHNLPMLIAHVCGHAEEFSRRQHPIEDVIGWLRVSLP